MRNWNWIWEWRYPSVSIGCEPTYEELKLIFSILPPPCFCCCEPTYEELKPCANNSLICLSYCCEPTYEELKLYLIYRLIESMNPLRAYLWGIETYLYQISMGKCDSCEPTYEELKQRQSIPMDYLFYVASLPMRNWNRKISAKKMSLLKVASLPMRNWNIAKNLPAARATWVASLPMRNWNFLFLLIHQRWNQVASLPMRNWNTIRFKRTREIDTSCEPTYEELKLDTSVKGETVNSLLRAYLWGIETVIDKGILIFLF